MDSQPHYQYVNRGDSRYSNRLSKAGQQLMNNRGSSYDPYQAHGGRQTPNYQYVNSDYQHQQGYNSDRPSYNRHSSQPNLNYRHQTPQKQRVYQNPESDRVRFSLPDLGSRSNYRSSSVQPRSGINMNDIYDRLYQGYNQEKQYNYQGGPPSNYDPKGSLQDSSPYMGGKNIRDTIEYQSKMLDRVEQRNNNQGYGGYQQQQQQQTQNTNASGYFEDDVRRDIDKRLEKHQKEMEIKMGLFQQERMIDELRQSVNKKSSSGEDSSYKNNLIQMQSQMLMNMAMQRNHAQPRPMMPMMPYPMMQQMINQEKMTWLLEQNLRNSQMLQMAGMTNFNMPRGHPYHPQDDRYRYSKKSTRHSGSNSNERDNHHHKKQSHHDGHSQKYVGSRNDLSGMIDRKLQKRIPSYQYVQGPPPEDLIPVNKTHLTSKSRQSNKSSRSTASVRLRRAIARRNLRIIGWTMGYTPLFYNHVNKKVVAYRKQLNAQVGEKLPTILNAMLQWMLSITNEGVSEILKENEKTLNFAGLFGSEQKLTDDEKDETIERAKKHITDFLEKMLTNTDQKLSEFPNSALEMYSWITKQGNYIPDYLLSSYELKRLNLNVYGKIETISQDQIRMLITSMMIVKLLVFQVLARANQWNAQINWTDTINQNFMTISSVLYRIAMHYLNHFPVIDHQNDDRLVLKTPPLYLDPQFNVSNKTNEFELILGMASQEQLNDLFGQEKHKEWIEATMKMLHDWVSKIKSKL